MNLPNSRYSNSLSKSYPSQSFLKNHRGVTLVELLVVLGIVAIMTVAIIPAFNAFSSSQVLDQNTENLVSDIKLVQQKSISGITNTNGDNVSWGIELCRDGVDSYSLGFSPEGSDDFSVVQTKHLKEGLVFKDCVSPSISNNRMNIVNVVIAAPGPNPPVTPPRVSFNRLTGTLPDGTDSQEIEVWSDQNGGNKRKIIIYRSGKIEIVKVT